jgi:hypothetical protein
MSCITIALIVLVVMGIWFAVGTLFWACCVVAKNADRRMGIED